jgi:hypothetical protein
MAAERAASLLLDLRVLLPTRIPQRRAAGRSTHGPHAPTCCVVFTLGSARRRAGVPLNEAGWRLQVHARAYEAPIDELRLSMTVMGDIPVHAGPSVGAYMHGPCLVGARWDMEDAVLAESLPMALHAPIGRIWLEPVPLGTPKSETAYECPLYQTAARAGLVSKSGQSTNFVCLVPLPAGSAGKARWAERGVAMLCQLSD